MIARCPDCKARYLISREKLGPRGARLKCTRCKIVFQNGKLNIFDLKGPEFAASSRFLPASENRFVRFAWVGPTPPPLGVERDADGKVAAVVIQVPGAPVRAERLPD